MPTHQRTEVLEETQPHMPTDAWVPQPHTSTAALDVAQPHVRTEAPDATQPHIRSEALDGAKPHIPIETLDKAQPHRPTNAVDTAQLRIRTKGLVKRLSSTYGPRPWTRLSRTRRRMPWTGSAAQSDQGAGQKAQPGIRTKALDKRVGRTYGQRAWTKSSAAHTDSSHRQKTQPHRRTEAPDASRRAVRHSRHALASAAERNPGDTSTRRMSGSDLQSDYGPRHATWLSHRGGSRWRGSSAARRAESSRPCLTISTQRPGAG